ncbi:hypothetical protein ACWDR0_04960 [Streptomyces sp. NPDC003691]
MLFTVPESGWWAIGAGSVLVSTVCIWLVTGYEGMRFPRDVRESLERKKRRGRWILAVLPVPFFGLLAMAAHTDTGGTPSTTLFMCSVLLCTFGGSLLTVRGRLFRASVEHERNPDAPIRTDDTVTTRVLCITIPVTTAAGALAFVFG